MTIRFVAARNKTIYNPVITRSMYASASMLATNDNGLDAANDDSLLAGALHHFAKHGLSAAQRARDEALTAHAAGDEESYNSWLSVCRMFDWRMADAVATRTATGT